MANILDTIKKISMDTYNSMTPSDVIIGRVVSLSPLKIRISDKITLEEAHFYKLKSAIGTYPVTTSAGSGTCTHSLDKGDNVLLLRCHGGERYVILGELIE